MSNANKPTFYDEEQPDKRSPKGKGQYSIENLQQKEAFEYYYSLGSERELRKVAEHVGKAYRTVLEWSRCFGWSERVIQYDIEASKKLKERTIKTVVEEKANYRKLIKAMVGQVVQDFQKGELKANNILDLERLIKLDMMLLGESTDITTVNQNVGLTQADRDTVNNLAQALVAENDAILEDD